MAWNISEEERIRGREQREAKRKARQKERELAAKKSLDEALKKFDYKKGSKVSSQHEAETDKLPWNFCSNRDLTVTRIDTNTFDTGKEGWPPTYRTDITAYLRCRKCHRTGVLRSGYPLQLDSLSVFKPRDTRASI